MQQNSLTFDQWQYILKKTYHMYPAVFKLIRCVLPCFTNGCQNFAPRFLFAHSMGIISGLPDVLALGAAWRDVNLSSKNVNALKMVLLGDALNAFEKNQLWEVRDFFSTHSLQNKMTSCTWQHFCITLFYMSISDITSFSFHNVVWCHPDESSYPACPVWPFVDSQCCCVGTFEYELWADSANIKDIGHCGNPIVGETSFEFVANYYMRCW